MRNAQTLYVLVVFSLIWGLSVCSSQSLDESPTQPGEWGLHPSDGKVLVIDPPSFVWRPQVGLTWEIQCSADPNFDKLTYQVQGLVLNVHCPAQVFGPGAYVWRYRGVDVAGTPTVWSLTRRFSIPTDATPMPMLSRAELLARIPTAHPRLFVRPEKMATLRDCAEGPQQKQFAALASSCERLLRNPANVKEPPVYPEGMKRSSDAWRKIWWGNRNRVQKALGSAVTLAFTRLLGGKEAYGLEAKRILLACAQWDPQGSTGYRYNDEAGMPYNYYFARTYTLIHDLLSEQEQQNCRRVMKVRGDEMYADLCPRHLWRPYSSHSNRAWHFLGEVALAFHGEVEGTEDWLWFAMNVFYTMYPVWSDDEGGWHEGLNYWNSYQQRFTWWADVMREVLNLNAYDKPYYRQIGYYPMYLMPPGKIGGGFGDLNAKRQAEQNQELMITLAAQTQNGHWQWYVDQLGQAEQDKDMMGFIRGALPKVSAVPPNNLPSSRLFLGTGQAVLNTQILDARASVQVVFKASPFGTQSHGYEANNSFLLWAYGHRLLIRSGVRDQYGSDHHRNWMWSTRSVNNITVNGQGQRRHQSDAQGEILAFQTTPDIDVVIGEAGAAYETPLERYTRALLFIKPDLLIVYDRLKAARHSTFEYHLHAVNKMDIMRGNRVMVRNGKALCKINFLTPEALSFSQTDQYDPNPRPRIKLREWHLTAATLEPKKDMTFITTYRIHQDLVPHTLQSSFQEVTGGWILSASTAAGQTTILLPAEPNDTLHLDDLSTTGQILIQLERKDGTTQMLKTREVLSGR